MADEQAGRRAGIVTLLFTDLVSSTELLDRLGDEDFERLRRIHFQLLREAVAASGGEEVKNLGDGLMVVFPSALDAIGCAVAMQQAVALHNAEPDVAPIAVRVGLHAGEPILEEDDYFGTPVVVAKRLCDRAGGGQILVSDLVAALVGGRRQFSFRTVGAVELKGIGEPMATREVVWRDDDLAAFVLTAAAGDAPLLPSSPTASAAGSATPPTSEQPASRRQLLLAGVGVVIAVLAVAGAVALGGGDGAAPPSTTSDDPAAVASVTDATSSLGVLPASALPTGAPRSFDEGREAAGGFFLVEELDVRRQPEALPIELREGEIITIRASAQQGAIQPFIELLGPDGAVVAFDVNAGGRGLPAIERYLVPAGGSYRVRVSPLGAGGRGSVQVIAFSEDEPPTADQPDAFTAVVALGEDRPEAAWMWDTGEEGTVKVRLQPHPDDPMIPHMQLVDGEGVTVELDAGQMLGDDLIELPHGGEWTIELAPAAENGSGTVAMQVWIAGAERPEPEKLR